MATKYNPHIHHRRSIRLRSYDYSLPGGYFVTICTQHRECILGKIQNRQVVLNNVGIMVKNIWNELPDKYPGVEIDQFIIMPNHIHGIIVIVGAGPRACPGISGNVSHDPMQPSIKGQPQGVAPTCISLPDIVHRFKSYTTARYRNYVERFNWRPFQGRLWQRNYFERIIRNDDEMNRIREYILNNPLSWEEDENNPVNFLFTD